ncbi:type IV pilin protein [Acinetobacter terrestris]|uniref:type IV pilin protein n=1 Tax=Acinetobacter terrestris TaxID=2529843 RepID=UPI00103DA4EF|nr:prepilin-type N-terminal cleavage/methylation domain-containing protein [Acinetobacter terrestris]TCB64477.1 prepilin-type N-terminal cleavage/methylation domain-containing protein [Acinetobacter terrestris]
MVNKGFTIIELMIAVAIIGVLAAIAYPGYQEYVRKTARVDAQSEMIEVSRKLANFKAANFRYNGENIANLGIPSQLPLAGKGLYRLAITPSNEGIMTGENWELLATPMSGTNQIGDGHIVLNHRGERCWIQGSDKNSGTPCVPGATTNWDGH